MGDVDAASASSVLLADADVLIDYHLSEITILSLVAKHVGPVVVLEQVLDEVQGLTAARCACSGIKVIAAETQRMFRAADLESNVSFNDRLCVVTCREERLTCVTNDRALRRLCKGYGVDTRYGLGLMVDLVVAGAISRRRAVTIARQIQAAHPFHINERVLGSFVERCREASSRRQQLPVAVEAVIQTQGSI